MLPKVALAKKVAEKMAPRAVWKTKFEVEGLPRTLDEVETQVRFLCSFFYFYFLFIYLFIFFFPTKIFPFFLFQ